MKTERLSFVTSRWTTRRNRQRSTLSPADNRLLAALPKADFTRLSPQLCPVNVPVKGVIQRVGEPLKYVYFPVSGVFSITTVLPDGISVETASVGHEGMVGIEAVISDTPMAAGETILQVPEGVALRLDLASFRHEMARQGALAELAGNYVQLVLLQMMQTAACNARHAVLERCAKWLLLTHDRVRRDEFQLSHEVLALMLATTRPTVTVVARTLQQAGLIAYKYRRVNVLDRNGLESAACPCYRSTRTQLAENR
jgi:CRP-like cAMP-binding protein